MDAACQLAGAGQQGYGQPQQGGYGQQQQHVAALHSGWSVWYVFLKAEANSDVSGFSGTLPVMTAPQCEKKDDGAAEPGRPERTV